MFKIMKWCAAITENNQDIIISEKPESPNFVEFRLLDDDGVVYGYGYSDKITFAPLDKYQDTYGCTEIQYLNNGKWETL